MQSSHELHYAPWTRHHAGRLQLGSVLLGIFTRIHTRTHTYLPFSLLSTLVPHICSGVYTPPSFPLSTSPDSTSNSRTVDLSPPEIITQTVQLSCNNGCLELAFHIKLVFHNKVIYDMPKILRDFTSMGGNLTEISLTLVGSGPLNLVGSEAHTLVGSGVLTLVGTGTLRAVKH